VIIIEKVGSIAKEDVGNCDLTATQLNAYADSTATERAQLNATMGTASPAERKALDARYAPRLQAAQVNLAAGMTACRSNPKVVAAIGKFSDVTK
jgi:hypothetical protein